MTKEKFDNSEKKVNIGKIGHINHEKTTLIAAIDKVLSEQNRTQIIDCDNIENKAAEKSHDNTINMISIEYEISKKLINENIDNTLEPIRYETYQNILEPVFKTKEQEELFATSAEKAMLNHMNDKLKSVEYENYDNVLVPVFVTQEQAQQFLESTKKAMHEHIKIRKRER